MPRFCDRGELEVRALWRTHFDDESISAAELRDRLRVAQASQAFFAGATT